jgi:hypothetical protein
MNGMGENERQRLIDAGSAARADGRLPDDNPAYGADGAAGERVVDWLDRLVAWQFGWELEDALRAGSASQQVLSLLAPFIAPDADEGAR